MRNDYFFHRVDGVTVLFADIEGFYDIADQRADVWMKRLNDFFTYFDTMTDMYRIEKIKTIGDAYMCAGGILRKNHPAQVVLMALEVQNHLRQQRRLDADTWFIRIGIHTGAVYAGMLGMKKLSYDIWGHTVNFASRIEALCPSDKIHISGDTYEQVKQYFICEYCGQIPERIGMGCSYYVKGLKPEYSVKTLREKMEAEFEK
ncbi:MAG: adenylate/guanylate cyclase domain-containing protein [Bacteroidales bacterium]|nr:adenylate/guanylate cyclase domain-containing protein [Bacteroidales bacterium]